SIATSMPMMAITTNSSTSVNPRLFGDINHLGQSKKAGAQSLSPLLFQLIIRLIGASGLGHVQFERCFQVVFGGNSLDSQCAFVTGWSLDLFLLAPIGRRDHYLIRAGRKALRNLDLVFSAF